MQLSDSINTVSTMPVLCLLNYSILLFHSSVLIVVGHSDAHTSTTVSRILHVRNVSISYHVDCSILNKDVLLAKMMAQKMYVMYFSNDSFVSVE